MDPSSNNHQLYTPAQQDTPSQQGYPPTDPYQYTQQPQNSYPVPNTNNNLNQLDQGCFKAYKIALVIEFLWHMYGFGALLHFALVDEYFNYTYIISFALSLAFMALILIQFSAMKDRNLHKAKMALLGFLGYFFICLVLQIRLILVFSNIAEVFIEKFFYLFLDLGLVLIGSIKVYQLLNINQIKSEADSSSYYRA